jgi:polysaccharide export outer membrane protein
MRNRLVLFSIATLLALPGCASVHEGIFADTVAAVADITAPSGAYPEPIAPADVGPAMVTPVALQGPQAVAVSDGPYLLDSGDKLRIFVYGQPNLSRVYTVDHGGMITVPLIGAVRARGLTTFDLEKAIRSRLGTQYVRDPQVTVDMQQNRPFFILGEVKSAGAYPYVSGMTVETAVAIGGGYSERANSRTFRITRRINGVVDTLEVPPDFVVLPGDTVFVFERYF